MKKYLKYICCFLIILLPSLVNAESFYINNLGGGLNTKDSPLILQDNESSDCQNVFFSESGAIQKRLGQQSIMESPSTGTTHAITGLYQFTKDSGTTYLICTTNIAYKMDSLDGTLDSITTGGTTFTVNALMDFETYADNLVFTNDTENPHKWSGSGNASALDCVSDITLTKAKWVADFKDRLFLANVTVSGTEYPNRVYYCANKDITDWTATDFLTIGYSDGEAITGLYVLGDRLFVLKEQSIWEIHYTGDSDLPFAVYKTLSSVGCASGYSVQEIGNTLIFLAPEGALYSFNGYLSTKISGRISPTIIGYSQSAYSSAVAEVYRKLNQYWISFASTGTTPNRVIVWDYYNNAFTLYTGIEMNAVISYIASNTETLLTGDGTYGVIFEQDKSSTYSDYDWEDTETAIDAYWWSKWYDFQDLIHYKIPNFITTVFYQSGNYFLDVGYQYDFADGVWKSENIDLDLEGSFTVGSFVVGDFTVGESGRDFKRISMDGQGISLRFKYYNDRKGENFIIYGFGLDVQQSGVVN